MLPNVTCEEHTIMSRKESCSRPGTDGSYNQTTTLLYDHFREHFHEKGDNGHGTGPVHQLHQSRGAGDLKSFH